MVFPKPDDFTIAVVLYETRMCGFCRRAKALLERRGINYFSHDVTTDQNARAWIGEASGQSTLPQIFIHGRAIGGYQELATLDRQGALQALLEVPKSPDSETEASASGGGIESSARNMEGPTQASTEHAVEASEAEQSPRGSWWARLARRLRPSY